MVFSNHTVKYMQHLPISDTLSRLIDFVAPLNLISTLFLFISGIWIFMIYIYKSLGQYYSQKCYCINTRYSSIYVHFWKRRVFLFVVLNCWYITDYVIVTSDMAWPFILAFIKTIMMYILSTYILFTIYCGFTNDHSYIFNNILVIP